MWKIAGGIVLAVLLFVGLFFAGCFGLLVAGSLIEDKCEKMVTERCEFARETGVGRRCREAQHLNCGFNRDKYAAEHQIWLSTRGLRVPARPAVNMRSGTGTSHPIVVTIRTPCELKKLMSVGNWSNVEALASCGDSAGLKGWIRSDLLRRPR